MTPEQIKKEADRLVEQFKPFVKSTPLQSITMQHKAILEYATRCALITVNREIETLKECRKCFNGGSEMYDELLSGKQAVKQELENRLR